MSDEIELTTEPPFVDEPKRGKTVAIVVAAIASLALVGGGFLAARAFFDSGADPAEAVPASAVGVFSINLDPSGKQKIEAFRFFNKFAAKKDQLKEDSDPRKSAVDEVFDGPGCEATFDKSVKPWIGERMAVALLKADELRPIGVLEVKDVTKAKAGLAQIAKCVDGKFGFAVAEGWAVLAKSDAIAEEALADAKKSPMADSAGYQKWTEAAGGDGIAALYVAKAAKDLYVDMAVKSEAEIREFENNPEPPMTRKELKRMGFSKREIRSMLREQRAVDDPMPSEPFDEAAARAEAEAHWKDFEGMGAKIRFADAGLEIETASYGANNVAGDSGRAAKAVESLPADTMAAFATGLGEGWSQGLVDALTPFAGVTGTGSETGPWPEWGKKFGLDLPVDLDRLEASAVAVSLGPDFDVNANDPAQGGDVGIKLYGDPAKMGPALESLQAKMKPKYADLLNHQSGEGVVVASPSATYLPNLLADGKLGDSSGYRAVVSTDNPSSVLYVDLDAMFAESGDFGPNLKPLDAFGASSWYTDGVAHALIRVSTD